MSILRTVAALAVGAAVVSVAPSTRADTPSSLRLLGAVTYDGATQGQDFGNGLALDSTGTHVFVTGSTEGVSSVDVVTLAYDTTDGHTMWTQAPSTPQADGGWDIAVSPDGSRVYVAGASGRRLLLVAADSSTGSVVWKSTFSPAGAVSSGSYVAVTPDGATVLVGGITRPGPYPAPNDYLVVAYDAATGARRWATGYAGPAGEDIATDMALTEDGSRVCLTGQSDGGTTGQDFATVGWSVPTGQQVFVARYSSDGSLGDYPAALAVSSDGGKIFVAGTTMDTDREQDRVVLAYDSAGTNLWSYFDTVLRDAPVGDVALSPDDSGLYVAGSAFNNFDGGHDYAVQAFTASGGYLWSGIFNSVSIGYDYSDSVAVSPDGSKIYVSGTIELGATDLASVAFSAGSGTVLSSVYFDGGQDDYSAESVLSPDGSRLYTTGAVPGLRLGVNDVGTVAYAT